MQQMQIQPIDSKHTEIDRGFVESNATAAQAKRLGQRQANHDTC